MRTRPLVIALGSAALGCFTGAFDPNLDATTSTGVESGGASDGWGAGGGSSGGDASGSSSAGSASDATSDGGVEGISAGSPGEPEIVEVAVEPTQIVSNGLIAVTVQAEDAEGVRMALKNEEPVELAPGEEAGSFVGAIPALTGLWNGEHTATLTPWAGEVEGEAVAASYTIELPTPGGQMLWETGSLIGEGVVKKLVVLPDGRLVEFGQRMVNGGPRCYLRRRDPGGLWSQSDVLDVLPGTTCAPIDIKIDSDGSLVLLALRTDQSGTTWWAGDLWSWGASPANVGLGTQGEIATSVAVAADGTIAVCGVVPTGLIDEFDAATWIYRKNEGGEARVFDYRPEMSKPNTFREIPRDCVFAGSRLVMAGEAFGLHEGDGEPKRDRHFIFEYDLATKQDKWQVGGVEGSLQSGARALVLDDEGRYVTAGFVCGDVCEPEATLRVQDPKGQLDWYAAIGPLKSLAYGPHDLAWSPAGYAVVAVGGGKGDEATFSVRAYKPGGGVPLWTFSRKDNQLFHMAFAVAVGPFGQVYAGGLGANSYPAVAYIAG